MTVSSDTLIHAAQDALWMAWLRHKDMREAEDQIEALQRRADEMREARDAHLLVFKRLGVLPETALDAWGGDKLRHRGSAFAVFVDEGLAATSGTEDRGEG